MPHHIRCPRLDQRDERGAIAMMVAVLAVTLFVAGAIAVDMGQVYAKRSALQSSVDHAVLAAAAELDTDGSCNSEVATVATEYLLKAGNQVHGQHPVDLTGSPGDTDGFIRCNDWKVELWAPDSWAEFGLGKAAGITGVDVPAFASAQIKSPAMSTSLPMYAASGCDSGTQQISDPPPGHTVTTTPDLSPDSVTHNAATYTITPTEVSSGQTTQSMTLDGTDLANTTKVTFTMAGGPPDHHEVLAIDLSVTSTSIALSVPGDVLAKDGVWWVRVVKEDPTGGDVYSTEENAQTFIVGDVLFCDGSISGNFGTLKLARSDVPNGKWVEFNMIKGLQPQIAPHPSMTSGDCDGEAGSVQSDHSPVDGTNCIGTEPGFPGADAKKGLIDGSSGEPGRLDKATTPGCSRTGTDSRTPTSPALNDDHLTCFIIDDSIRIQDVVDGVPNKLSADIFSSPRFFQIPLFPVDPSHGASQHYPVLEMVPGFITSEPTWRRPTDSSTVTGYNGIEVDHNTVQRLDVVLFSADSLPDTAPATGGEIDYLGYGTKVIVLVE